jgi:8-oxo-dGTP pyrophosphatase MutT (NUDIX family)
MNDAAPKAPAKPPRIRDAATMIIVRQSKSGPTVLMGERSSGHVFFPHHYVFPGGRVDRADGYVKPATNLRADVLAKLTQAATERQANALAMAAVRETFEEAGLIIGAKPSRPQKPPKGWEDFFATGNAPCLENLSFIYRAVTPPGRPRRFNARFFVTDAENVQGDMDRDDQGDGELLRLKWFKFEDAYELKIRPVTAMALKEIENRIANGNLHDPDWPVPWSKTIGKERVYGHH